MSNERLFQQRQAFYKGRAKIYLRHFQINSTGPRSIRENHATKLSEIFETEGISRLNPENYIKVSINNDVLQQALAANGRTEAALRHGPLDFLNLPDVRLNVLHGNHRLLAAVKNSAPWWVAELYSDDMDVAIVQQIREEHSNAQPYCDGDIYRNVRHYERLGDVDSELKWRGRFSKGVHNELARMEKDFKRIRRALDKLIPFSGMWQALKLSYLGRWLSLKCPEEIVRYLEMIYQQWSFIIGDNTVAILDSHTVDELETLMPGISLHDKAIIEDRMARRKIFSQLESDEHRSETLTRVLSISGRILSLHTFTRDFIYFEACMGALKPLQPLDSKSTMYEGLSRSYLLTIPGTYHVQVAENSYHSREGGTNNMTMCYQQLFLAVMRDFPTLTNLLPYRDDKRAKPKASGFQLERDLNLAQLAKRLGFENDAILAICERAGSNRYLISTEEFLHQAQPADRYDVEIEATRSLANYVSEGIINNSPLYLTQQAFLTTDLEKLPKKLRCNRPSYKHYENDRKFLFLDILYHQEDMPRSHATSFAVQRDIFFSFFGKVIDDSQEADNSLNLSPNSSDVLSPREDLHLTSGEPSEQTRSEATQEASGEAAEGISNFEPDGILSQAALTPGLEEQIQGSATGVPLSDQSFDSDDPLQVSPVLSPNGSFETHSISTQSNLYREEENFAVLDHSIRPSSFIKDCLSRTNDLLLYIWQSRQYIQLSSNPEDAQYFHRVVRGLANQQHVFISSHGPRRPHIVLPKNLYNTALHERFILVGPKVDRAGLSGSLMSQTQQESLFNYIDRDFELQERPV